jgi:hypothetical protein
MQKGWEWGESTVRHGQAEEFMNTCLTTTACQYKAHPELSTMGNLCVCMRAETCNPEKYTCSQLATQSPLQLLAAHISDKASGYDIEFALISFCKYFAFAEISMKFNRPAYIPHTRSGKWTEYSLPYHMRTDVVGNWNSDQPCKNLISSK